MKLIVTSWPREGGGGGGEAREGGGGPQRGEGSATTTSRRRESRLPTGAESELREMKEVECGLIRKSVMFFFFA